MAISSAGTTSSGTNENTGGVTSTTTTPTPSTPENTDLNIDLSFDTPSSPALDQKTTTQIDFSKIEVPEISLATEKVQETISDTPSPNQNTTEEAQTLSLETSTTETPVAEISTTEKPKEENLSLDLPNNRDKPTDTAWIANVEPEASPEPSISQPQSPSLQEGTPSPDKVTDPGMVGRSGGEGFDPQAISLQKIQQSQQSQAQTQITAQAQNTPHMLNLDDLGTTTAPAVSLEAPAPIIAPVSVPQAPSLTSLSPQPSGLVLNLDTISAPASLQAPNTQAYISTPSYAPATPYTASAMPSYNTPTTTQLPAHHISSTRKMLSMMILVLLIIGGGIYVTKTMFPDKYDAIIAKIQPSTSPAVIAPVTQGIPQKTGQTISQNALSGEVIPFPGQQIPQSGQQGVPPASSGFSEKTSEEIEKTEPQIATSAPMGKAGHSAPVELETGFDPFVEVDAMIGTQPSAHQETIDKLQTLLAHGEEYFVLGDTTQDADILKYANVLIKKIPEDIELLKSPEPDMAKIEQHMVLFENYLKKLEAMAPLTPTE